MSLIKRLPTPLSERLAAGSAAVYDRMGQEVDVAIGGIPFRLATFSEIPQTTESLSVNRDQFDTELDPGEQSLSGWWRRSQASWHEGAGYRYQESPESRRPHFGFHASEGVDVFSTQGQISLLKAIAPFEGASTTDATRCFLGATTGVVDGENFRFFATPTTAAQTGAHAPGGGINILDGIIAGTKFLDVADDGNLYYGDISAPGSATSWPTSGSPTRMAWGKHRLWLIGGRSIWQPDLTLAAASPQTAIFTNPDDGFTYTCMAEGPSSMYFAGHNDRTSTIQAITLDDGGAVPTLSGAAVTVVLPEGELIQEIAILAGQYVGIGTSSGFRVGTISGGGTITYGPLLFEDDDLVACTALCTQGRFFVAGFETTAGGRVYRIDTGTALGENLFPYASDVIFDAAYPRALAAISPTQLFAIGSDGDRWVQSTTEYVDSGWIEFGRVRFGTTENKSFKQLEVCTEVGSEGTVTASLEVEGGSVLPLGSIALSGTFEVDYDPLQFASPKLVLTGESGTNTPLVQSWLLKALPSVTPQWLITLPLLCFDREQARSGQQYGQEGYALDRFYAIQALADGATTVTYQDYRDGSNVGRRCVIESVRYTQTAAPPSTGGSGGILLLQLRTVD